MTLACFSIGAAHHKELLRDFLLNETLGKELKTLQEQGLQMNIKEQPFGSLTFLAFQISCCDRLRLPYKNHLTKAIAELITTKWKDELLKDIIKNNYYYFNDQEKLTIYDYAQKKICYNEKSQEKDKRWVLRRLSEYLNFNSILNIDGFIRFRLKEYVNDLYEAANQAVDDFLSEREYQEFIQLLRYFVEIQDSRLDMANVVFTGKGVFKLYDGFGRTIDNSYLKEITVAMPENEINYEDILISALITIAPRKITLHTSKKYATNEPSVAIETINQVFTDRVSQCPGCPLCRPK